MFIFLAIRAHNAKTTRDLKRTNSRPVHILGIGEFKDCWDRAVKDLGRGHQLAPEGAVIVGNLPVYKNEDYEYWILEGSDVNKEIEL